MSKINFKNLEDDELLMKFNNGVYDAYTEIYTRYSPALYRHAHKMLNDRASAQDVIQEVFTNLWINKSSISFNTSVKSYLYTSVRNKILDLIAKEKSQTNYLASLEDFIHKGYYITDNLIREKELEAIINKEISSLPNKMREVFELSRKEYKSYADIAQELGMAENTVRKHINKALSRLRTRISDFLILAFTLKYFF
ncbi:RNA polymerase sigma factor [Sphingobacterium litopenaei]|uniref:RNA polymerase sigma-70 factor n=1 Tax=Sphingobacterium litopenaei TaxID=2763500 RepID=A0ABR7YBU4_9SPHI|nr:RNA polymerase sigma-70 factor [Sphingobacterium litopenaei]MBD1428775.1 RNA polymerase sigma-70 factor [Sphingobacterium litopenaei]